MFLDVDDFIPREYIKNIIKQKNRIYTELNPYKHS